MAKEVAHGYCFVLVYERHTSRVRHSYSLDDMGTAFTYKGNQMDDFEVGSQALYSRSN